MSNYLGVIFCLIAALAQSPKANAASSAWADSEAGRARLISAQDKTGSAESIALGLEFALKKGWKIYWRSPGEAGYAPKMDWSGSDNLQAMDVAWPTPERFTILGIETIGYKGDVTLPLSARLERPGEPLRLKLNLDTLACSDICVPVLMDFTLDLPGGDAKPSVEAQRINQFQSRVPGDGVAAGLRLESSAWQGADKLVVTARAEPPFNAPDLFVEGPTGLAFAPPKVSFDERGRLARFVLAAKELPKEGIADAELVLTVADGIRGMEARVLPGRVPVEAPPGISLIGMIGLALLGGLILNLMPCVLPVLSLKILGLIGHGGAERGPVRLSFAASALGILSSFLILGGAAMVLKLSGSAVGWGMQFQEPMFLAFLAALVVLFAANMAGFYEIGVPQWLGGSGRSLGHPQGPFQHFLSGMFATLLATPCSAPFLGTAIGFALAAGPLEIMLIFFCLGLGMAGPYLAVAAWPGLAASMPRPGPWMLTLKRLLALALLGTAFWLLWVIGQQAGEMNALAVILSLCLSALAIFLFHRFKLAAFGWLALLLALAAVPAPRLFGFDVKAAKQERFWRPFDEAKIPELVRDGKIVFVDVTADWCVTCQVNKRLVLEKNTIRAKLDAPGTVAMKADWTRPSDSISAYLAKFGRYGIPFNVVYGPKAPEGVALPELLSEEAVTQAMAKAKAP